MEILKQSKYLPTTKYSRNHLHVFSTQKRLVSWNKLATLKLVFISIVKSALSYDLILLYQCILVWISHFCQQGIKQKPVINVLMGYMRTDKLIYFQGAEQASQ